MPAPKGKKKTTYNKGSSKIASLNRAIAAGKATVTGHGDYRVKKNSMMLSLNPPVFKNHQKGGYTLVSHREYVAGVYTSSSSGAGGSNFSLTAYDIQPGNAELFPWLSQIAQGFQEYELMGMVMEFRSLATDSVLSASSNGTLGSVIMATNYNSADSNYANKIEMLESQYSSENKPSLDCLHPIECTRSSSSLNTTHLYIRTGSIPANQDQRLYDHGNFQIATQGMQYTSALVGDLWCIYHIRLYKPILGGGLSGLSNLSDKFQLDSVAGSTPLGTTQVYCPGSNLGCTINGATGTILTFPSWVDQGTFLILIRYVGTTAACTAPIASLSSAAVTLLQVWSTASGPDLSTLGSSTTTNSTPTYHLAYLINIGPNNVTYPVTLTLGTGGTLPTNANGDLIVSQVNNWAI